MLPPVLKNWTGAKNGSGVWQTIINQLPPHAVFVELFVGSGAVTRRKKLAASTIVVDADAAVAEAWRSVHPSINAVCDDARSWLKVWRLWGPDCVIYADPPYLRSVRSCKRDYYRHEFATDAEHRQLLGLLRKVPAKVVISGYPSALYARELKGWRTVDCQTITRSGARRTERLWMNFPEPTELHDDRFLGRTFRERERIKRKKARWVARLRKLPPLELATLFSAMQAFRAGSLAGNDEDRGAPARIAESGAAGDHADAAAALAGNGAAGSRIVKTDDTRGIQ